MPLQVWAYYSDSLTVISQQIPENYKIVIPKNTLDLNQDMRNETVQLLDGRLSILNSSDFNEHQNPIPLWQSPQEWKIIQASVGDLNNDKKPEISILLWRKFSPWPIDRLSQDGGRIKDFHDATGKSCHVILIGWMRGKFREVWAGSALVRPLNQMAIADLNGDGREELIALEGKYDTLLAEGAQRLSLWEWNGFGFTLLKRSDGIFHNLNILSKQNAPSLILTQ